MNILFLTMSSQMLNLSENGIYNELVKCFRDNGHSVYIMTPFQRCSGRKTSFTKEDGLYLLGVRTLNVSKTNVIEKGIGQLLIGPQFKHALKKYLDDVKFDLTLYSTPPITFTQVIKYAKNRNSNVKSYLMLKDIFPQNAVDMGMLTTSGLKGIFYRFFRNKEKDMYKISDFIGCMSPANVKYLLQHNIEIDPSIVEICPNSFNIPNKKKLSIEEQNTIRNKYGLPCDKPIFFYGGNLGKPQGIPFLIECLNANKDREDCHFLIIGSGTDYPLLEEWVKMNAPKAVTLIKFLPKDDYDRLAQSCDIGLIFLDYRFTIPNYPSRLLNCLMLRKPIIAVTDFNSDIGSIAEENGYGIWSPSNNTEAFTASVNQIIKRDLKYMGELGYQFFLDNYTVVHTYNIIMNHFRH